MASTDGNDFSGSFTDLMTSLAIVFLILSVGMVIINVLNASDYEVTGKKYIEDLKIVTAKKMELLDEIKKQFGIQKTGEALATADDCVTIDAAHPFRIVIRFNGASKECLKEGLFFKENDFLLDKNKVDKNLSRLSNIYGSICSDVSGDNQIEDVQIVGHTDAKAYFGDDENCLATFSKKKSKTAEDQLRDLQCGNLYLSSQRARTVFLLVSEKIRQSGNSKNLNCFKKKTQASGRGPFEPKIDLKSGKVLDQFDAQQKRVEIVFNFKQPNPLVEQ